jgi:hypothetical protein
MSKSMFNLMALLQNLHPLEATNLKGENESIKREFVWKPSIQKPLLHVVYSNRLYLNKLYLKTKVRKSNLRELKKLYMKYIPWKPLLKNNSTFHNSQKHSLLKAMNFQNLTHTHTFLLTLTHVKDVWNKDPLDESVNFMWKHKHGPKLVSLSCFLCLSLPLTTFKSTLCWNSSFLYHVWGGYFMDNFIVP